LGVRQQGKNRGFRSSAGKQVKKTTIKGEKKGEGKVQSQGKKRGGWVNGKPRNKKKRGKVRFIEPGGGGEREKRPGEV